jgi:hypothetical protein
MSSKKIPTVLIDVKDATDNIENVFNALELSLLRLEELPTVGNDTRAVDLI